jgi:hypothetical protein
MVSKLMADCDCLRWGRSASFNECESSANLDGNSTLRLDEAAKSQCPEIA